MRQQQVGLISEGQLCVYCLFLLELTIEAKVSEEVDMVLPELVKLFLFVQHLVISNLKLQFRIILNSIDPYTVNAPRIKKSFDTARPSEAFRSVSRLASY